MSQISVSALLINAETGALHIVLGRTLGLLGAGMWAVGESGEWDGAVNGAWEQARGFHPTSG